MLLGSLTLHHPHYKASLKDLHIHEYAFFIPMLFASMLLGIWPQLFLSLIQGTASALALSISTVGRENLMSILSN